MTTRKKFSPKVYMGILLKQNGKCNCGCQEFIHKVEDINWDHILALHLGGKDEPENIQALLKGHHVLKSNKEASARAKVVRIQDQGGLRRKKKSRKDKVLSKALGF